MRIVSFIAFAILAASSASFAESPHSEPARAVERLQSALLDSMHQAPQRGRRERSAALRAVVSDVYDLDFMARTALGRGWKGLDSAQQQRWVDALGNMISATLVDGFGSFAGESFQLLGEHPAALDTVVVETQLVAPHDDAVAFDYRLRRGGESWRVIDVYVDGGTSEVALRRAEYGAALERRGFDELIADVQRKTEALLARPKP